MLFAELDPAPNRSAAAQLLVLDDPSWRKAWDPDSPPPTAMLKRTVSRIGCALHGLPYRGPSSAPIVLRVAADGSAFAVGEGAPTQLRTGNPQARILAHLIVAPPPVTTEDLIEAGWPGEAAAPGSARNRLYVALHGLRNKGLAACLRRDEVGYRLADQVRVVIGEVQVALRPSPDDLEWREDRCVP